MAANGTAVTKYQPLPGTDQISKNGQSNNINTRHHCITAMKEYEAKCLEELRVDDYSANRKGPQAGNVPSGGIFSSQNTSGIFGAPASQPQTSGLFGSTAPQNTGGLFGATSQSNSLFTPASQNNSLFSAAQPQATGLFSAKPANTFGTTNTA